MKLPRSSPSGSRSTPKPNVYEMELCAISATAMTTTTSASHIPRSRTNEAIETAAVVWVMKSGKTRTRILVIAIARDASDLDATPSPSRHELRLACDVRHVPIVANTRHLGVAPVENNEVVGHRAIAGTLHAEDFMR